MSDPTSFHNGRVNLHAGDCLAVLKTLPDCSVDSCVTDPPYHLTSIVKRFGKSGSAPVLTSPNANALANAHARMSRGFMGKAWDGGDIAFQAELWAEILRVLKPGGHVVAFSGTRTYHRMACAIEDAGFEIRDQLAWVYGTGFPKSLDVSKAIDKTLGAERTRVPPRSVIGHQRNVGNRCPYMNDPDHTTVSDEPADAAHWQGWGTALKPAWEPICLGRKPLGEATVAGNVLAHGTGAINVDACRIDAERPTGWTGGAGGVWNPDSCGLRKAGDARPVEGRFPANILHDGSAEVLAAFPETSSGVLAQHHQRSGHAQIGTFEIRNRTGEPIATFGDSGSAARFFYSAKADADDRLNSKHPTVKVDLMRWLVRLVTPLGGTRLI